MIESKEPAGFQIRVARESDLDGITELLNLLHEDQAHNPLQASESQSVETWHEMLSETRRLILVAENDSGLVGTLDLVVVSNLTHQASPWAVIENMVVGPSYRRRGVGRALMREAIARCQAVGAYKIQLLSNRDRRDAHDFYLGLGFEQSAEGFRRYF